MIKNAATNVTARTIGIIPNAKIHAIRLLARTLQIRQKSAQPHPRTIIHVDATDIISGTALHALQYRIAVKQVRLHADFPQRSGLRSLPIR